MTPQRPGFDFRGRPLSADPDGVVADEAYRAGYEDGRQDAAEADRLEAVIAWAVDYFGDTTQFPSGLAFALWTGADSPRCHCGKYPVDPDHCLTLYDRDDTAVERHAAGACEGRTR